MVGETGCLGESLPTPLFPALEKRDLTPLKVDWRRT